MDKVMKAEIEKILHKLCINQYCLANCDECLEKKDATSSITSLIIKWLEGKKEDIKQLSNYDQDISMRPLKIIRNQLITELIGEIK